MDKAERRDSRLRREDARRARGQSGAAGVWILPAALAVLLALALGAEIVGAPRAMWIAPVYEAEEDAVVLVKGEQRLDINRASEEELRQLSGIGEVLAGRIVQWREENGPFESVEQLTQVEGIGEGKLEALLPFVTTGE